MGEGASRPLPSPSVPSSHLPPLTSPFLRSRVPLKPLLGWLGERSKLPSGAPAENEFGAVERSKFSTS